MSETPKIPLSTRQKQILEQVVSSALLRDWRGEILRAAMTALPDPKILAAFQATIAKAVAAQAGILRQVQPGLARISEQAAAAVRRYSEIQARYLAIMPSVGWPPTFDVPLSLIFEVVRAHDASEPGEARAAIDRLMEGFYSDEELQGLVTSWDTYLLRKRLPIVRAALRAHEAEEWVLTVPALLCSLEGVIAETGRVRGHMSLATYKKLLRQAFSGGGSEEQIAGRIGSALESFYVDVLLQQFEHGDPIPLFSRHAILHGADLNYGTRANSIKSFLLLHLVQKQFGTLLLDGSQRYHRVDCRTLRRSAKPASYYRGTEQAQKAGASPCRLCH